MLRAVARAAAAFSRTLKGVDVSPVPILRAHCHCHCHRPTAAARALQWRVVLVDNVARDHASLQEAASAARSFLVPLHLPHWAAAKTVRARGGQVVPRQARQTRHKRRGSKRIRHGRSTAMAARQWRHGGNDWECATLCVPRPSSAPGTQGDRLNHLRQRRLPKSSPAPPFW